MKLRNGKTSVLLTALLVGTLSGSVALCQPPDGGFGGPGGPGGPGGRGGFGGPGGPGGPGGFGGRGMMGGQRNLTLSQVPASALSSALTLNATQKTKVQSIQDKLKTQREAAMPRPGQNPGERPDPETMRAAFDKLRQTEEKANKDIEALLTTEQKSKVSATLKSFNALREVGIPLDVYAELKLTAAQKQQLQDIAKAAQPQRPAEGSEPGQGGRPPRVDRRALQEKAMAVLTDEQKKTLDAWMEAHPRPQGGPGGRGGFGGPGRPGGFGGDGPPPPPGGEGGDPPPPPPGEEPPLAF